MSTGLLIRYGSHDAYVKFQGLVLVLVLTVLGLIPLGDSHPETLTSLFCEPRLLLS